MKHLPPLLQESIEKVEDNLIHQPEDYWLQRGQESTLNLFHEMAERVPAYKDFLQKKKINHVNITSINDLNYVPAVDKDSYLKQYPYESLCWDGKFSEHSTIISATSGSTGEPFYFPRTQLQDLQYARIAELYLRRNFSIQHRKTLYINGFAMGVWIGGVFTYQAIRHIAESGHYSLSIVTPGVQKSQIINAVKKLGAHYDQIIIGGYPPMIKDVIDEGKEQGIVWDTYTLGFVFSAEGFTEAFRDYILAETGCVNPYMSTLNHYGTVDLGTMAHETPDSILVRRLVLQNEKVQMELFNDPFSQPTFAQFVPELFYFEADSRNLLCSAWSGIPLVKYDLKDIGGVYTYSQVKTILTANNIDLDTRLTEEKLIQSKWNLPFVYVHERADFVVKLYGANIYPQTIRKALLDSLVSSSVTGKFTMVVEYNAVHQPELILHVELKKDKEADNNLELTIQKLVVNYLLRENSEFKSNYSESPERQIPIIKLWKYEDSSFFTSGGKQKWVRK